MVLHRPLTPISRPLLQSCLLHYKSRPSGTLYLLAFIIQKSLDNLEIYCNKWNLTVNIRKTKNKGGRLTNEHWTYKGQEIEVVNSFKYLGVVLTSGGAFIQGSKTLADKALKARYCLFECLKGTKAPINRMLNLFDSQVASILNYGAEVWGFISAESIERVHRKFCKRVLSVKLSTNNYGIYKELGRYPLFITRQIRIVKYWLNLATNTKSNCILSSVYSCTERHIAENVNQATWLSKVKHLLTRNGFGDIWQFPESVSVKLFLPVLKTRLADNYLQELREGLRTSPSLTLYRELNANFEISPYLKILCNWKHGVIMEYHAKRENVLIVI